MRLPAARIPPGRELSQRKYRATRPSASAQLLPMPSSLPTNYRCWRITVYQHETQEASQSQVESTQHAATTLEAVQCMEIGPSKGDEYQRDCQEGSGRAPWKNWLLTSKDGQGIDRPERACTRKCERPGSSLSLVLSDEWCVSEMVAANKTRKKSGTELLGAVNF